jgi:hypothetical protein
MVAAVPRLSDLIAMKATTDDHMILELLPFLKPKTPERGRPKDERAESHLCSLLYLDDA